MTNRVEETLTGDFAIVNDVLRECRPELSSLGFEYVVTEWGGSPKLRQYPVFKFRKKRTNMELGILFSLAGQGLNGGFVATITKPKNHLLDVKDYLRLHGHEDSTRLFSYRDPNTDIRVFAQDFCRTLLGVMRSELAPVLDGKIWEDTPIDWQGYK